MAELAPFEQIDAGGVDSRSNPINMPRNRALRCLNWVPKQGGWWELRWGYSTVTMSTVTASALTGMFPYRTWDGTKYVIFAQGTILNVLNTATGAVTTPTVKGAAIASSAKGNAYFAANRFHYGNGTDQKWFDSSVWRTSGLRALTTSEVANITVTEGVRELTSAEAAACTLTLAAGGSFPADTLTGRLIYVVLFDYGLNEIGPATINVGAGRVKVALNNKLTVSGMPNLTALGNWVHLIAGTIDGGNLAYFFTNTSTNVVSCTRSTTLITVVATGHGLTTADVVILSGTGFDGVYRATVIDANTFTVGIQFPTGANTGAVGTVKRIVMAQTNVTTVDVLAPTQDTSYQVNQNIGLPSSVVGTAQAGYQFYASIYNPNGGQHVGNRMAIGGRALQTAYRSNWHIAGLPNFSGIDPEWQILIGRTGDGAAVPYVCTDNALNWAIDLSGTYGQILMVLNQPLTDGQHEMPSRNGIIPSQCNMFCVAGDFAYAADPASPYLRRSGDMSQNTERGDTFTGRAEQSWAPDDIDTFPTGEAITGIFSVDQEVFCGTLHDSALSVNLAGVEQWVGPWGVGVAGPRAGAVCGAHGFYWLSGDRQLCTLQQGGPVVASEEYELAELSQFDRSTLGAVELVYYRSATQNKDELRIEGLKTDGTPYTVIHDFKLLDPNAPSLYGQGYSSQYKGPLAVGFTAAQVRDSTGGLRIYAGASTGQIYQLYMNADDVGNQYTADLILLINGGKNRPDVRSVDWHGDGQIDMSVGQTLSTSFTPGAEFGFEEITPPSNPASLVQGSEDDFLFRGELTHPEIHHVYVRFQLVSHSADGNLLLNSPPHIPLETYGRLYELIPEYGDERGI